MAYIISAVPIVGVSIVQHTLFIKLRGNYKRKKGFTLVHCVTKSFQIMVHYLMELPIVSIAQLRGGGGGTGRVSVKKEFIDPCEVFTTHYFAERLTSMFKSQSHYGYFSGGATISIEGFATKFVNSTNEKKTTRVPHILIKWQATR